MGWSIDTARPDIDRILKELDIKYRILREKSAQQAVVIEYLSDTDLAVRVKNRIVELFPDFVYIEFVQVVASQEVGERMRWDN